MPELPEVETVKRDLNEILKHQPRIVKVDLHRKDLRKAFPKNLSQHICGQKILKVERRAKYLLIYLEKNILLSHLGMTGDWRIGDEFPRQTHDHCEIFFEDGRKLVYRDPRRFGVLDLLPIENWQETPYFKNLGPEPFDLENFSAAYLKQSLNKKSMSIKPALMDQRVVVGVGNIYASEALFRAQIHPGLAAGQLSLKKISVLVEKIREVLKEAIDSGGSTIRDYLSPQGGKGSFQSRHFVYERADEPCAVCKSKIKKRVDAGRSTYWCPKCQGRGK